MSSREGTRKSQQGRRYVHAEPVNQKEKKNQRVGVEPGRIL